MRLDQSFIAIRERGILETLDLAWQVISRRGLPLLLYLGLGALPLAILNFWISRSFGYEFSISALFNLLLVYCEAPLGTLFVTSYLGRATFEGRPSWRVVTGDVLRQWLAILFVLGLNRLVFPTLLFLGLAGFSVDEDMAGVWIAIALLLMISSALIRGVWAFPSEILILEKTPLQAKTGAKINFAQRSRALHLGATSTGVGLTLLAGLFSLPLLFSIYGGLRLCAEMCGFPVEMDWLHAGVLWQTALWMVAGFWTIARFLFYMDTRIRQEGWEVELKIRAIAMRMSEA